MKTALRLSVPVLFSILAFGASAPSAFAATVSDQVDHYTVNTGAGFYRSSAATSTLSDTGGIVSQITNQDGSVTVNASSTSAYADSGFYVTAGTLGDLKSILVKAGSGGDAYGLNIWFNNESFTWVNDKFQDVGSGAYSSGPTSNDGTLLIDGTSSFYMQAGGSGTYTLNQLKSGIVSGITSDTQIAFWVGVNVSGSSKSATIQTLDVNGTMASPISVDANWTNVATGTVMTNGKIFGYNAFATIQGAVNAANSGDTINVAEGTYTEQLTINKNLTVIGAGDTTVIQSPDTLTSKFTKSGNPMKPVITVDGATANISHLQVDGAGKGNANSFFVGIGLYNSGGNLDHVTVTGIKENPTNYDNQGEAIVAINTNNFVSTLSIASSTISDFQRNGLSLSGNGLTVTISGNTITGSGHNTQVAQNGIQISGGAIGSIQNNTVGSFLCDYVRLNPNDLNDLSCTNNWYSNYQAEAISLVGAGSMTVSGNAVSNSDTGIHSDLTGVATITNNTLTNNRYFGMLFGKGDVAVTGGSVTGGQIGIFNPLEHNTGTTAVHNVNISGNSVAGLKNDAASFNVDATNNWWGNASGPLATTTTPVLNLAGTGNAAIGNVTFNPWYINVERTILNTDVFGCMDSTATNYNSSATNQTGVTCTYPSRGGSHRATPAVPANVEIPDGCAAGNKFSTTTGRNCNAATPATPSTNSNGNANGQVLGAATFNFTRNLGLGLSGDDVTELQKILIAAGILKINAPTGTFGQLTKAAVQAFQKQHGVSQTGFVGPLTRGELNKGSLASSGLSTGQASAITGFLQAFDADQSIIDRVRAILGL